MKYLQKCLDIIINPHAVTANDMTLSYTVIPPPLSTTLYMCARILYSSLLVST